MIELLKASDVQMLHGGKLIQEMNIPISKLMNRHPDLAVLLMQHTRLRMTTGDQIPTAGTDGATIWFNEEFALSLPIPQRVFLAAHELMHIVLMHPSREVKWKRTGIGPDGKEYNQKKFHIAADLYINSMLVDCSVGEFIPQGLFHPDYTWKKYKTDEELYAALPPCAGEDEGEGEGEGEGQGSGEYRQGPDGEPGKGGGQKPDDKFVEPDHSTDTPTEQEMERSKREAADNYNRSKQAGSGSGLFGEWSSDNMVATRRWEDELRSTVVTKVGAEEWTYKKPHRQYLILPPHIISPGPISISSCAVAIIGDVSGSVSNEEKAAFTGEMAGIITDAKPEAVHVFFTDTRVVKQEQIYDAMDLPNMKWPDGGGTDMEAAYNTVQETMGVYDEYIIVCLTDGYTHTSPENAPIYAKDMIWCTTGSEELAYGTVIKIEV